MGLESVNHGDWNNDSSAAKISVPVPCDSHPAQPETSPVIRIRRSRKHENPLHIFRPYFLTPSRTLNPEPCTINPLPLRAALTTTKKAVYFFSIDSLVVVD